jgi:hypothetical protein
MDKIEIAIIAIILVAVLAGAALPLMSDPLSAAIVQAQPGIKAPGATMTVNTIGSFLLRLIGFLLIGLLIIAIAMKGYELLQKRQQQGPWVGGQNAYWRRNDQMSRQPAAHRPSLYELIGLLALGQFRQQGGGGLPPYFNQQQTPPADDEFIDLEDF